jgi:hypothetical protein
VPAELGILRMFTQFGRMAETLVDHALNSRGLCDEVNARIDVDSRRHA